MGLFDKLRHSRKEDNSIDIAAVDCGDTAISDMETAIADCCAEIDLNKCVKLPFKDIGCLGALFSGLVPALRTVSVESTGYIPVNMNPGDMLKCAKDGFNWGAHITADGKSVMTKWAKNAPIKATMPVNPAMVMMAVMLVSVEKKLDAIQETQHSILSFLEQDKQAEQQGNLNVLTDILTGYKYNLDKQQFLQNGHMKALDIKQSSEKNVLFYREQITSTIQREEPAISFDNVIGDTVSKLVKQFKNYRMALYLFAFSSYLDAMLLGNFTSEYLEQIACRVDQYNVSYHNQFTECLKMIEKLCTKSLQTGASSFIGSLFQSVSKIVGDTPIIKNSHADEWLQKEGNRLLDSGNVKAQRLSNDFAKNEDNGSEIFIENIRNISRICNQTQRMIVRDDAVYLAATTH